MYRLYRLIIKNFRLLIRSKVSALIIIIGPLLVIFLTGIAYNNRNPYSIKVGIYAKNFTKDIQSVADELVRKKFRVYSEDSEETGANDIRSGKINTCIIFPDDIDFKDVSKKYQITYYIDNSRMNIVYSVMDVVSSQITSTSVKVTKDITGLILKKIRNTRNELKEDSDFFENSTIAIDGISQKIKNDGFYSIQNGRRARVISERSEIAAKGIFNQVNSLLNNFSAANSEVDKFKGSAMDSPGALSNLYDVNEIISNARKEAHVVEEVTRYGLPEMSERSGEIISNMKKAGAGFEIAGTQLDDAVTRNNALGDSFKSIRSSLGVFDTADAENISSPIKTVVKPVSKEDTYLNYLLPGLIVLLVMFISILLASTLVMLEKHTPAYFRNSIIPVPAFYFVASILVTTLIILIVQIVIILIIAQYYFQAKITENVLSIFSAISFLSCTFVFFGMTIGYFFTSEETGTLAAISAGSAFMLISDLILPLESMPESVLAVARFNPFILGQVMLKRTILFQTTLRSISWELTVLAVYSVILLTILVISQILFRSYFFRRALTQFRTGILQLFSRNS